ncbi:MAG TPA: GNAT family N-acetyltransferase [Bacteroidales bacterium]|nr:GNAT family N-acetyltransferase [Bacteroidales bacterium]HPD28094.1 GNAT family N-acetyltransferase [Paludibacteraceae bacterium]
MLKIEVNPPNFKKKFIEFTNESFKSSFDINNAYDWMFERKVGKIESDIIVLRNDDEIVAGSGLTYRQLILSNGQIIDMAIMTSSWTLPSVRGKGYFSKIIELSKEIAFKKDVHCLIAFVTEKNASYRRLKNAGSYLIPAYYLFSSFETTFPNQDLNIKIIQNKQDYIKIFMKRKTMLNNCISFYYNNPIDFENQFINRYLKTEVLQVNDSFAIVEETFDIIKLLLLTFENKESFTENIKHLIQWSKNEKNKPLLFYTTDPELCNECKSLNFDVLNGYITMLFSDELHFSEIIGKNGNKTLFDVQYGDKM